MFESIEEQVVATIPGPPPVAKPEWLKSPLRGEFWAQNTFLFRPKGPCGTTFCHSQSEIYDIGTEFLFFHCFATKIIISFYQSIIPEDSEGSRRDLAFYNIKT